MSVFVVDSNFFIQAHRVVYPLDVVVSFWDMVRQLASEGKIISIDKVRNEIYQNNDELKDWCQANLPDDFFKSTESVIEEYGRIVEWTIAKKEHYTQKAIEEFLDADEADAWIVSYCFKYSYIVTTYETSQPDRKNRIKIPEPCESLGVSYLDTMEMFRKLEVKF